MSDDQKPDAKGEPKTKPKTEKPDPVDDLVITHHTLRTRAGERLHRPHGPRRAAGGGGRGRRLQGLEGPRGDVGDGVHAAGRRPHDPPDHVRLQRRPGLLVDLAPHGPARPAPRRPGRPHRPAPAAVPPGRQRRDAARGVRPGLHRPDVDRPHPHRRGRQAQGLPRLRQGRRAGHRADPAVVHARGPLDVAEVRPRRVLRDRPGGRGRRAALDASLDGPQRHHPHLERSTSAARTSSSTASTRPA